MLTDRSFKTNTKQMLTDDDVNNITSISNISETQNKRERSVVSLLLIILYVTNSFVGVDIILYHYVDIHQQTFEYIYTLINSFGILLLIIINVVLFFILSVMMISYNRIYYYIRQYILVSILTNSLFNIFSSIVLFIKYMDKQLDILFIKCSIFKIFVVSTFLLSAVCFIYYIYYFIYQKFKNKVDLNDDIVIAASKQINNGTTTQNSATYRGESNRKDIEQPVTIFNINLAIDQTNMDKSSNEDRKNTMFSIQSPVKKKSFTGIDYNDNDFTETSDDGTRNRRKNKSIIVFEKKKEELKKSYMEGTSSMRVSNYNSPERSKAKKNSIIVEELKKKLSSLVVKEEVDAEK